MAATPPRSARAEELVAVLPRVERKHGPNLTRFVPSGRSTAIAVAVAALAALAYLVARETSIFALQRVEVVGAPAPVASRVRAALRTFEGGSLVTLDGAAVMRRLDALPVVASARYDRDFPHTLRVFVRAERAVAVLRRGSQSWLVSSRGRVMGSLRLGSARGLPRIWIKRSVAVSPGGTLSGNPARAVAASIPLDATPLRRRVSTARVGPNGLALVLRSGLELRLGDLSNLRLKLQIGARIAELLGAGTGYVDLSVPGRPVSGGNSQP